MGFDGLWDGVLKYEDTPKIVMLVNQEKESSTSYGLADPVSMPLDF
jgi:hypothetical protein